MRKWAVLSAGLSRLDGVLTPQGPLRGGGVGKRKGGEGVNASEVCGRDVALYCPFICCQAWTPHMQFAIEQQHGYRPQAKLRNCIFSRLLLALELEKNCSKASLALAEGLHA